ncbi:MAG: LysR family transcriptional regulator [Verrucomicrobia bacterium]|nr:LysR family transcriptional regulator [Verrucomicrobiota bacterium]MBS0636117.1 LysR family transcriptional regulator [Verrucomicrobiota bacterium]
MINTSYLKYFFDAVRTGSISQAARFNHVSQSAVSQGIAKLESSLNCTLISHQPNRFRPTEEGRRLYESSKSIFQAIQRSVDELTGQTTITFACYHSFALTVLPKIVKRAQLELPHLRINFRLGNYFAIKELIKKRVVDFGIMIDNDDLSSFDCHKLMEGEYRLYAAKGTRDIAKLPFLIDNEERKETNLLKSLYKARYDKELPVLMEVMSWSVVTRLAEEGLGIALAPDYIAQVSSKLKPVLSELNPAPYKIFACFEKNIEPSVHEREFLKLFMGIGPSSESFLSAC